jgi:[acyl-carrier-protein] S-malonyltransferase
MTLALLFPGQGSQYVGMARALAEAEPRAAEVLARANEILGLDLARLLREGPEDELTETKNAQPAILVHSVAALTVAEERLGTPAFAAGHSLGEFSAHVAAGTLSFEDALSAVRSRFIRANTRTRRLAKCCQCIWIFRATRSRWRMCG